MDENNARIDIELPVVINFVEARTPRSEIARRVAAEATQQATKLAGSVRQAGIIRLLSTGRSGLFNVNPYLLKVKDGWNCRDLANPENVAHVDSIARSRRSASSKS